MFLYEASLTAPCTSRVNSASVALKIQPLNTFIMRDSAVPHVLLWLAKDRVYRVSLCVSLTDQIHILR